MIQNKWSSVKCTGVRVFGTGVRGFCGGKNKICRIKGWLPCKKVIFSVILTGILAKMTRLGLLISILQQVHQGLPAPMQAQWAERWKFYTTVCNRPTTRMRSTA